MTSQTATELSASRGRFSHVDTWIESDTNRSARMLAIGAVVALHGVVLMGLLLWRAAATPAAPEPPPILLTMMEQASLPKVTPPQPVELTPPTSVPTLMLPNVVVVESAASMPAPSSQRAEAPEASAMTRTDLPSEPRAAPIVDESEIDYQFRPPVEYPAAARRMREQGTVWLLVAVDEQGRVQELTLLSSAGSERLDRAAMRALRHARFHPYRYKGVPRSVQVRVPVEFALRANA